MTAPEGSQAGPEVATVVRSAIQNLVAARLGRGFVPLAGLFAAGVVGAYGAREGALAMAGGAVLSAASMLTYGLTVVDGTAGPVSTLRKATALASSVVPPVYGIFILGWPGLQGLASATSVLGLSIATLYVVLGVWVLRSWLRVVEVRRLAQAMVSPHDVSGDSA